MLAFLRRFCFFDRSAQAGRADATAAAVGAAPRGARARARARAFWLCALGLLAAPGAQALQVKSFVPQGEVARVRQVVVQFDRPAVAFGDAAAPAPLQLSCSDAAAAQGAGHVEQRARMGVRLPARPAARRRAARPTFRPGFKLGLVAKN